MNTRHLIPTFFILGAIIKYPHIKSFCFKSFKKLIRPSFSPFLIFCHSFFSMYHTLNVLQFSFPVLLLSKINNFSVIIFCFFEIIIAFWLQSLLEGMCFRNFLCILVKFFNKHFMEIVKL